jgi:HTH-type transcriptional regulator/antitoxin HigA
MVAEAFPPGDFLKEELEERNWTQEDLANVLGKSARLVSEVINAKRSVTPDTAKALAAAFGTSAAYWMNLESAWQLYQASHVDNDDVARRANLYGKFPVKEMIKRGWIESSSSIDVLETRFCEFFQISSIAETPKLAAAFRRSDADTDLKPIQLAWLYRSYKLAQALQVTGKFTRASLKICFDELRTLLHEPVETRQVGKVLSKAGIRFLIVEPFPGSLADGVCFWLDDRSPVVVMSLRLGRIDNFWFSLMHEMRHVANGDGKDMPIVDENICESEPTEDIEIRANKEASEFLIPSELVADFIDRVSPLYSFQTIIGFAATNEIHPGIVVGRLQTLGEVPWTHFRKLLEDIRKHVTQGAITDGWGFAPLEGID